MMGMVLMVMMVPVMIFYSFPNCPGSESVLPEDPTNCDFQPAGEGFIATICPPFALHMLTNTPVLQQPILNGHLWCAGDPNSS